MFEFKRIISNILRRLVKLIGTIEGKTGVISFFLVPYIRYRLSRPSSIGEILENLYGKTILALLFKPSQVPQEIFALCKILENIKPKYVLEIGTAHGGTLLLWTRVADDRATIISVDLPGGPFGGGYPFLRKFAYLAFKKRGQKIILIRADSHDIKTLENVKKILQGNELDFLFLDGDHSYNGVRKDFVMYSPLVRQKGIIAFHDIVPDYFTRYGIRTGSATDGVPKFWQEIKHHYKHQEIVQDYDQDGCGIGIIYWE